MPEVTINYNESLANYYHYIMDYLHDKYDQHSIEPTYMNEYRVSEMNYYEAQARYIVNETRENLSDSVCIGSI